MPHVTYTEFRQSLASFMDRVCDSRAPLTITRQKGRSVVVLDEGEYDSMMETIHLLKSPENARRLTTAIAQLASGDGIERDIVE
ncbi:type II toxin-antitoxin system Phd/YefM family antitoxin [Telmatospirillum siberiense]|uniref:Antitoxin n=1 Tax=Telmatospirillum siberiense TaxID=382514 RepID=A0A2N3PTE7_9PROT|nr:type II toxin-antitoxin system prevent-host-death family antitoxin [Telmatospirillum siberiense]PKU23681.1 prevent-host-death protein [Telmatospirillum siberiense]